MGNAKDKLNKVVSNSMNLDLSKICVMSIYTLQNHITQFYKDLEKELKEKGEL